MLIEHPSDGSRGQLLWIFFFFKKYINFFKPFLSFFLFLCFGFKLKPNGANVSVYSRRSFL